MHGLEAFFTPCSFSTLLLQPRLISYGRSRGGRVSSNACQGGASVVCCTGGQDNEPDQDVGENGSVDWDKAWSSFSKQKKGGFFPKLNMEKYVTRSPRHPNYPLSEEVDSFRKTEKKTLAFWTDSKFTIAGFGVIVALFVYMVVIVGAPPIK